MSPSQYSLTTLQMSQYLLEKMHSRAALALTAIRHFERPEGL